MDDVEVSVMGWVINNCQCQSTHLFLMCVRNSLVCIKADVFLWTCKKVNFIFWDVMRVILGVFLNDVQMMMVFMPLNVCFFMLILF